jgi:cytosine/adenosine deaminase-related metal-dependent hydrolase
VKPGQSAVIEEVFGMGDEALWFVVGGIATSVLWYFSLIYNKQLREYFIKEGKMFEIRCEENAKAVQQAEVR